MSLTAPLASLPDHGYVFHTSWPLYSTDIDQREQLGIDGVARYLQEAGAQHLVDAGAFETHQFWVVRRTVIDVIVPIAWPNTMQIHRWCSGISPRWCNMRVRLAGEKGGLIETEGFWINMNMETKGPSRMEDRFFNRLATTTREHRLRWKPWVTTPFPEESDRRFALRHADTDRLDHVNNAIYMQAMREVLPDLGRIAEHPFRLVLEYDKPIVYGEDVRLTTAPADSGYAIWMSVDGDVRARAAVLPLGR